MLTRDAGPRDVDPAVFRAWVVVLVLVLAPCSIVLGDTELFVSDVPLAALVTVTAPSVARRLRAGNWALRALAVLVILLAVAWVFHPSPDGAIQVFRLLGTLAIAATVVEAAGRDNWRVALAASAAFQAIVAAAQTVTGGAVGLGAIGETGDPFYPVGDVDAPTGTLLHPYVLAAHALVIGAVLAVRATDAESRRHKVLWTTATAVAIAPVGFTYSRAAALGALALGGALAAGAWRGGRRFAVPLVAIVLSLGITAALGFDGWSGRVAQTTDTDPAADLTTGRGELTRQAATMIGDSPIVGAGPSRYVDSLPPSQPGRPRKPVHNIPLLAAAEGGVLAGIAAALILLLAGWNAVRRGWATAGLWLAFLPLLLLDHLAYTFPAGLILLGVWVGTVDRPRSRLPASP